MPTRLARFAPSLLFAAQLAASLALPLQAQRPTPALTARFDSLVGVYLAELPSAGLSAAIVRGRDTLLWRAYGLADREANRPATMQSVYRLGSITKQFTAAAVMQLVEQRRVALDDTLGRFLPEYPRWGSVTIRQPLTHTSGIPNYSNSPRLGAQERDLPRDSILLAVRDDPFVFPTGSVYGYSNTNYFLLGLVLERVTGKDYETLVREQFFQPLGLRSAKYCPRRFSGDDAIGYTMDGTRLARGREQTMTIPFAAGALCMNVPDYLRWQQALTSGRVVRPESYAQMSTSHRLASGTATSYGFGLVEAMVDGHRMIRHGGGITGFSTDQAWMPDDSLRIVVFTNVEGRAPAALVRNLAAATLGLPLQGRPDLPPAVALPPAERDRYVGKYAMVQPTGRIVTLSVTPEEDGLAGQVPGGPRFPLVHIGEQTFASPLDRTYRLTFVTEGGQVVKAIRRNSVNTVEGARVQ